MEVTTEEAAADGLTVEALSAAFDTLYALQQALHDLPEETMTKDRVVGAMHLTLVSTILVQLQEKLMKGVPLGDALMQSVEGCAGKQ